MTTLQVIKAGTWLKASLGLIGKTKIEPFYLKTRFGIHTFGMKVPIDVVVLNKEDKVVKLKKNLKPNRIFVWNPRFDKVIELPYGTIEKMKITLQEKLNIVEI